MLNFKPANPLAQMQVEFEAFPAQVPPFKHTKFVHAFDWGVGVGIGIQWPIGPGLINKIIKLYLQYLYIK